MVLPSVAILPPPIARLLEDHAFYVERNLLALRNTRLANLFGGAALTLPAPHASCGLMAMGPAHSEERLLRLGAALESALA